VNLVAKRAALVEHLERILPMAKKKSVLDFVNYVRLAIEDDKLALRYNGESQHYNAVIPDAISYVDDASDPVAIVRADSLAVALTSIAEETVRLKKDAGRLVVSSLEGDSVFAIDIVDVVIMETKHLGAQFSFTINARDLAYSASRVGACVSPQEIRFPGIMFAPYEGKILMLGTDAILMSFCMLEVESLEMRSEFNENKTFMATKAYLAHADIFGTQNVRVDVYDSTVSISDGVATYAFTLLNFSADNRFAIRKYLQLQGAPGGTKVSFVSSDMRRILDAVDASDKIAFFGQDQISKIYFFPQDDSGYMPIKSAGGVAAFKAKVEGDVLQAPAAYNSKLLLQAVFGFGRQAGDEKVDIEFYQRYAYTRCGRYETYLAAVLCDERPAVAE